jgi:hypothetical protein
MSPRVVVLSEIAQELPVSKIAVVIMRSQSPVWTPDYSAPKGHNAPRKLWYSVGRESGRASFNVTRQLRRHNDSCDASSAHV